MKRYTPTEWKNQVKDADGEILQEGTPINATNMNKLENAVAEASTESHTHDNKAILDKVTQKDLDDIKAHGITLTDHEKRLVNIVESITSLKIKAVQTIAERDALTDKVDKIIHVVDASADPTVTSGWAQYIYQASKWVKIAENESIDVVLAWANITGKPATFAPSAHTHKEKDITDLDKYTKKEVTDLLAAAKTIVDQHMGNTTNPHSVTKEQIGLGNVLNYNIAAQNTAELGATNSTFMSPLRTRQFVEKWAIDNPATTAKDGIMTATDKASLVKAIADIVTALEHITKNDNPHGVTKAQVGLGLVPNFEAAGQTSAEQGTANALFMTPLRTKQAIDKFVPTKLSGFTNDTSFPASEAPQFYVRPASTPPTNPPINSVWFVT